jgi:NifU-like protein involved in Fe-S cluster formation
MPTFSDTLLAHFRDPKNSGDLADPTCVAELTNPVCGDVIRLSVKVEDGKIIAARFKAQGCVPAIAAASVVTDMLVGKTMAEARHISPKDIAAALGEIPEASSHAIDLCCDAISALC